MDTLIRPATTSDAPYLQSIYAYYVEHTAVSFELESPSVATFRQRMEHIMEHYPYFVAESPDGQIVGYAYAGQFHPRGAFAHCVESTVYLHPESRGLGVGSLLMDALEEACRQRGFLNIYASIASTEVEDEYLTRASIHFHTARGYRLIGEFRRCGHKFDRWYDMVWMGKFL